MVRWESALLWMWESGRRGRPRCTSDAVANIEETRYYYSPSNGYKILPKVLSHWLANLVEDDEDRVKEDKEEWCGELAKRSR